MLEKFVYWYRITTRKQQTNCIQAFCIELLPSSSYTALSSRQRPVLLQVSSTSLDPLHLPPPLLGWSESKHGPMNLSNNVKERPMFLTSSFQHFCSLLQDLGSCLQHFCLIVEDFSSLSQESGSLLEYIGSLIENFSSLSQGSASMLEYFIM